MKLKLVRNAGQSQRSKFVLLVIGCFLVSMAFIFISRPSALSSFVANNSVTDKSSDVSKNNDIVNETGNSLDHSSSSETEPQSTQSSVENYEENNPLQEEKSIPEDRPETKPEKNEEVDDQPTQFTMPTLSNYTINDLEKTTAQEDSDPAPWNPNRNPLCDTSGPRADVCDMTGQIRIAGNKSTVIFYEAGDNQESYSIRPYARKGDDFCLDRVRKLSVKSSSEAPKCTITHNVPAIMFSAGGYSGNQFHDFTDILIPLFVTAAPYDGEVKLVVTDFSPFFIYKYLSLFKKISKYPVIDYENDNQVHCFRRVIVGLFASKELSIDPQAHPKGNSMLNFTKFLRAAYSLQREETTNIEDLHAKKPRMLVINRKRSRTILNIEEISSIADDLGFELVVNDDADIGADMAKYAEIVNSCDVLIGVHGSGLTNAVFLPPKSIMIQIVPWGNLEDIALYNFGNAAKDMELNYLQYSISIDESSLVEKYPRDHTVFTDPKQYHSKDFNTMRATFLDSQNVKLDMNKFRSVLWKALEHVIQ